MLTLTTDRLVLRAFQLKDGPRVRRLAGAWDVASMVGNIPHPYPEGAAEAWIETHTPSRAVGAAFPFAATWNGELIGAFGIQRPGNVPFELGYWVGRPYWGCGFATEAAEVMVKFAFDWLGQEQLDAAHIIENAASARVLEKLGFTPVGEDEGPSLARGTPVMRRLLRLTRDAWAAKKV